MNRVFNEKAFLNYNAFGSIEELVDKVAQIDQNDDLYVSMLCESRYNAVDYEEKKFKGLGSSCFIFSTRKRSRPTAARGIIALTGMRYIWKNTIMR